MGGMVNGKAGDSIVVREMSMEQFKIAQPGILDSITSRNGAGYPLNDKIYYISGDAVLLTSGKQSADGIFPTCENTMIKLWLPLIGYLTFFCGLMHLLSDSGAIEKLARFLSPLFHKIFPLAFSIVPPSGTYLAPSPASGRMKISNQK